MRVAIVGSRDWSGNFRLIDEAIQDLPRGSVVISGGARGVDRYAAEAARRLGVSVVVHEADWTDRGAGMRRNTLIVADCDALIAFWDGKSRGTSDSILKAHAAGKRVTVVLPSTPRPHDLALDGCR